MFDVLTANESEGRVSVLNLIEEKNAIELPVLYRQFQLTFKTGQYSEKWEGYVDKYFRIMPVSEIIFKSGDIRLSYGWLFSPNELNNDIKYYSETQNLQMRFNVIRIGNIISGGGLYLGVGKHNKERIYKMLWDYDNHPVLIADTIYDFLNCLVVDRINDLPQLKEVVGKNYYQVQDIRYSIKEDILSKILYDDSEETISAKQLTDIIENTFRDVYNSNFG